MSQNLNRIHLGIISNDHGDKRYSVWSIANLDDKDQLPSKVGSPNDRIDNFSNPNSPKFKEGIYLLHKAHENVYVAMQIKPAGNLDNESKDTYYGSYLEFVGGYPTNSKLFTLPISVLDMTIKWFEDKGINTNLTERNHFSESIDNIYSDIVNNANNFEGNELFLLDSLNNSINPVDIRLYRRETSRNTTAIIQVSVSHDEAGFPVMDKQELDRAFSVIFKTHALDVYEQIIIASSEFTPNMVRLSQNTPEHIKVFKLKEFEMEMMEFWVEQTIYHIRAINAATNYIQSQKACHKDEVEQLQRQSEVEKQQLKTEISQLQQQREADKQQLQAEIERRNNLLKNAEAQFNELKERAKSGIDNLQVQLASKEEELNNRQAEIAKLQTELASKDELLKQIQQDYTYSKHLSFKNIDNQRLVELKQSLESFYKSNGAFTLISVNENISAIDFVNQEEVNREVEKQVNSLVNNEIVRNRAQAAYEIIKSLNDTYLNLNSINRLSPAKLEEIINTITASDLWNKLTPEIQAKFTSEYEVFRGIVAKNTHIPEDEMDSDEELEFVGDERPTRAGKGKKSGSKLMLMGVLLMSLFAIAGVGAGAWMYFSSSTAPVNQQDTKPKELTEDQIKEALDKFETSVNDLIQKEYKAPTVSGKNPASCDITYKITDNTISIVQPNIESTKVCNAGKKAIAAVNEKLKTDSDPLKVPTQPEVLEKLQNHEFKITFNSAQW